jgi:hypothetical protein
LATIDLLKRKRAQLRAQLNQLEVEIAALERVPQQQTLPAFPSQPEPERKQSPAQQLYGALLEHRAFFLEHELGVAAEPDEPLGPAAVNTMFRPLLAHVEPHVTQERSAQVLVLAMFDSYLKDPWASSLTPAFPIRAFLSGKVWPKHSLWAGKELDS